MRCGAGLLAGAALLVSLTAAAAPTCPKASLPPLPLPHVSAALARGEEVLVVALGSSSTAGSHASDMAHTYPAVLQAELERRLPGAHVAVLNRGVGGQDADEMIVRLERDAVAPAPTLVIWQVGANGAMRGLNVEHFAALVSDGVRRIEAAGADVVLMDNQRSPAILASPEHTKIDQALADVAGREHAKLFARGRLMDMWQEDGHEYAEFLADDGIHHNDRGYICLGQAVAESILAGLTPATDRLHAAQ